MTTNSKSFSGTPEEACRDTLLYALSPRSQVPHRIARPRTAHARFQSNDSPFDPTTSHLGPGYYANAAESFDCVTKHVPGYNMSLQSRRFTLDEYTKGIMRSDTPGPGEYDVIPSRPKSAAPGGSFSPSERKMMYMANRPAMPPALASSGHFYYRSDACKKMQQPRIPGFRFNAQQAPTHDVFALKDSPSPSSIGRSVLRYTPASDFSPSFKGSSWASSTPRFKTRVFTQTSREDHSNSHRRYANRSSSFRNRPSSSSGPSKNPTEESSRSFLQLNKEEVGTSDAARIRRDNYVQKRREYALRVKERTLNMHLLEEKNRQKLLNLAKKCPERRLQRAWCILILKACFLSQSKNEIQMKKTLHVLDGHAKENGRLKTECFARWVYEALTRKRLKAQALILRNILKYRIWLRVQRKNRSVVILVEFLRSWHRELTLKKHVQKYLKMIQRIQRWWRHSCFIRQNEIDLINLAWDRKETAMRAEHFEANATTPKVHRNKVLDTSLYLHHMPKPETWSKAFFVLEKTGVLQGFRTSDKKHRLFEMTVESLEMHLVHGELSTKKEAVGQGGQGLNENLETNQTFITVIGKSGSTQLHLYSFSSIETDLWKTKLQRCFQKTNPRNAQRNFLWHESINDRSDRRRSSLSTSSSSPFSSTRHLVNPMTNASLLKRICHLKKRPRESLEHAGLLSYHISNALGDTPKVYTSVRRDLVEGYIQKKRDEFYVKKKAYELALIKWKQQQQQIRENGALEKLKDFLIIQKPIMPQKSFWIPQSVLEELIYEGIDITKSRKIRRGAVAEVNQAHVTKEDELP